MAKKTRREKAITKSIHAALFRDPETFRKTLFGRFLALFTFLHIKLIRFGRLSFWKLRNDVWEIDDEEYRDCFRLHDRRIPLQPVGDLGYSGSTFFRTVNGKYLIKSLPRHFEYSFFRSDLFEPYCDYVTTHPDSFLVRITDYVYAPYTTLGALLRITPAHHIIMENVLCGKDQDPSSSDKWETYDLKPIDYFYPERDLLPDPLVSEETLDKLADVFEDKIRITRKEYEELKRMLDLDTKFLQDANAVDYSLFLVRFPADGNGSGGGHARQSSVVGRQSPWRAGVRSVDGKWKYRAVLLDFFWAKHKLHAQALTGVVQTFNVIGRMGPMTITTTADEYRQKFLAMVDGMVEVHGQ